MRYTLITVLLLMLSTSAASTQSTKEVTLAFIKAFEAVRQPDMKDKDMVTYLSFMADDIVDYHAAYGVRIEGKERPKENIIRKLPDNISFDVDIEDLIVGTSTSVVVLKEQSEYRKDGEYKRFAGRTILVLEFDSNQQIKEMRRYLD